MFGNRKHTFKHFLTFKTYNMKRILLMCFMLLSALVTESWAQDRTVSGKITDDTGEAIPGANVILKGTTTGTTSDIDGNWKLSVPSDGGVLVFTFVGMSAEEVEIGSRSVIDVAMASDAKQLTEVVVTAMGIEREQKALGYAVQNVGDEEISKTGENNVISALNGKVAGVQITSNSGAAGAGTYIKIRGNSTLTGSNQPLFVVDGMPINNETYQSETTTAGVAQANRAMDINPDDVESIAVLKGAAATALYGIRAANGAVIITTKKGKVGKQATSVKISTSYTVDEVNKLPPRQMKYGQGSNGVYSGPEGRDRHSWGPDVSTLYYDPNTEGTYIWNAQGQIVEDPTGALGYEPIEVYNPEDQFYEKGSTLNTNVAVTGGNEFGTYRLSAGRVDQTSVIPGTKYEKTTARLNASSNLTDKITTSGSFAYTKTDRVAAQQGSNVGGVNLGLYRTPITFDNTQYEFSDGTQRSYRGHTTSPEGNLAAIYDNPFWIVNKTPYEEEVDRFMGQIQLDYKPFDWLGFTYRIGTDMFSDRREQKYEIGSANFPDGRILTDEYFVQQINSDLMANVNKTFGDISLSAIVGQNMYYYSQSNKWTEGDVFGLLGFPSLANASLAKAYSYEEEKRTSAVYGDVTLSWQETVFLNATVRSEWTSTLLSDVDNNFTYPSVSLGYVFTETLGLGTNSFFSFGKLRASWGQVGNDAPVFASATPYEQADLFSPSNGDDAIQFPFGGTNAFIYSETLGNNTLVPETTTTIEVGADLRFFSGKLTLDGTYYTSSSVDQILAVPIAGSTGFLETYLNAGEIENKGIELVLTATPISTASGLNWDVILNFSKNENKVIKLADGVDEIGLNGFTGITSSIVAGYPYGTFFGNDWMRDDAGNVMIDDNPSSAGFGYPIVNTEQTVIGDPNPDWMGGLRNTVSYKGLSFSFFFDVRKGGDIWNGTRGALITMGTDAATLVRGTNTVFDGVLASSGAENDIEVPLSETWFRGNGGGFGNQAAQFVEDGSWIRLRDISLTYSLPKSWLSKISLQDATIGVQGRNLWLSTNYSGIDPETNLSGNSNGSGFEYFNMPNTKSYGFNVSVTF